MKQHQHHQQHEMQEEETKNNNLKLSAEEALSYIKRLVLFVHHMLTPYETTHNPPSQDHQ